MRTHSDARRIPAGALVALALVLLLAGFLLGRRSSSPAPTPPTTNPAVTQAAEPPTVSSIEPAADAPTEEVTPTPEPLPGTLPALVMPTVAPTTAPATPDTRGQEEIERYFEEADAIEARARYWSDPQALAKTILEQAGSGSTAGFDELIGAQRGARDELARLSVPAACTEHHRRSLAVMAEGLGLLERVRNALGSGDLGGLDGLQEQARALEREARAIDELAKSLRRR
jgi:hypothetical protein